MLSAVNGEGWLGSPTVGTWWPRIGVGAPISAGMLLGRLQRAGRFVDVVAPEGAGGMASQVTSAGEWLEYGAPVLLLGEVTGAFVARAAAEAPSDVPEGTTVVRADSDGTIWLSPEPGAPAFAPLGGRVDSRATLALVEVMKTFTQVRSSCTGTVARVLPANGAAVTAGDALFWIAPAGTSTP